MSLAPGRPGTGLRARWVAFWAPPLRRLRLGYAAWLLGIFRYFLPAATWNPASRFALTRAIVEDGRLSIDRFADSTGDRARAGEHGYSDKAPLVTLLAVPPYQVFHWIDRSRGKAPDYRARGTAARPAQRATVNRSYQRGLYVCSLTTAGLAGVAFGLAVFELLRRRSSVSVALSGSALCTLGTPVFPYATAFYGHVVAAALLALALLLMDRDVRGTGTRSSMARSLGGACLAASVGCEYVTAVPAAVLASGWLLLVARQRRLALARQLLLGALGPALVVGAYHWACFGAPWRTGYSFIVDPIFAAGHAHGLLGVRLPTAEAAWGLSFGRSRGLCYVSTLAAVLAVGVLARSASRDALTRIAGLAALALFGVNASYYMWWGGAAAAPRHLVPTLGFLALGLGWCCERRWRRAVLLAAALLSPCNMLAVAAVGLEAPERGDVLVDFVYARLLQGKLALLSGASNLGIELGLVRGGSLGPLLVWVLLGAYVLHRQLSELPATQTAPA